MADANQEAQQNNEGINLLLNEAMSSHLRLPMLEVVYDRFIRVVSTSLRNYTSDNVDVEVVETHSTRFKDYMDKVDSAMIAVFKAVEWENFGILVVSNASIYSFVDVLFGGRKAPPIDVDMTERGYTSIERNIVRGITDLILKDLSTAFDPVTSVNFQLDRLEANPKFATIARPGDVVIILKLKISMEDRAGEISVMLPYATIEPIKKLLAKSFIGEKGTKDPIWLKHMEDEIGNVTVGLKVLLDGRPSNMEEVVNMKIGNTIILDSFATDELTIQINNIVVGKGVLGKVGENIAIQLTAPIIAQEE